ncbi:MAG: hypothetical protein ABI091_31745 [Ferruginibacter sp.]
MIIEITDKKTIADVQDKFSTIFPFLKIEFFERPHHWYEKSPVEKAYPATKTLGEIRKQHPHGSLEFFSVDSTGKLEQMFRKKFSLNAQVFRLHGNAWIQTVDTDKLSLKEQNEIGRIATLESLSANDLEIENESLV